MHVRTVLPQTLVLQSPMNNKILGLRCLPQVGTCSSRCLASNEHIRMQSYMRA